MDVGLIVFGIAGLLTLVCFMPPLAARLKLPYSVLLAIVGFLLGIFMHWHGWVPPVLGDLLSTIDHFNISSDTFLMVFLPVLLFETALSMNVRRLMDDMLETIGKRLPQIQAQADHFGLVHDNVIASSGALYQDTLSTLRQRIQVHGDMRFLQQAGNASKIRALLLSGIRAARLWRQLGGHRWQLVFSRRKLLNELYDMMRG